MEGCPEDWSRQGIFVIADRCITPLLVGKIIDIATICLVVILLVIMLIMGIKLDGFMKKPTFTRILISQTIVQEFLMLFLPVLSLFGFFPSDPWIGEIIHTVSALMANIPIGFMYLELRILIKNTSMLPAQITLGSVAIAQVLMFLLGPPIVYLLQIDPHIAFWIPVIFVDFTVIPLFSFFGVSIHRRIHKLHNKDYRKSSRRIIISIGVCGVIGIITGSSGIVAIILREFDWIFLRICWIAAIIFDGIIFASLMGRKRQQNSSRPSN